MKILAIEAILFLLGGEDKIFEDGIEQIESFEDSKFDWLGSDFLIIFLFVLADGKNPWHVQINFVLFLKLIYSISFIAALVGFY